MKIPKSVMDLMVAEHSVAFVVVGRELFPWVRLTLLDAQRDPTTLFVYIQNHDFNFIANEHNFGRVNVLVGPVHFGNVYQTFDTFLNFNKATVVSNVRDFTHNACAFWVPTSDVDPRVFAELLETQRNAIALPVELQNLYFQFIANVHHLGRMLDALPRHVGDVQEAVDATQVHKHRNP